MKMEFGQVAKKMKSALTGKTETTDNTPLKVKQQVAGVREASENLKNALESVRYDDRTGKILPEKLIQYQKRVGALTHMLDMARAYELDTRTLDKKMIFLAEHLTIAIRNGCSDTADRIMTALIYGVERGHEPVPSSDEERMDQIMTDRENRLSQYRTIVEFSEKIDEREKTIDTQNKKYNLKKEEFSRFRQQVLKEADERPDLVKLINEYGGRVGDLDSKEGMEAFALVTKQREARKRYEDLKNLKGQMALNEANIVSCRQVIASEENALTEMAQMVDQRLIEEVAAHELAFRNHLVELQKQIGILDELSLRFNDALDEIFSSPEMGDYLIESSSMFREMEHEIASEKAARDEGRRLMQEREQAQMNEQKKEPQLINK